MPLLTKLLRSTKSNIVKEAAWTVSNIAAGTIEQITEILQADIVPLLVEVLRSVRFQLIMQIFIKQKYQMHEV